MKRRRNGWGVILVGFFALAAPAPGQPPAANPAMEQPSPPEMQPEPAQAPKVAAEGENRRDPFRPFLLNLGPQQSEGAIPRVGVTAYELRQLTLVAVLLEMSPPRALLEDSSGMGYIVIPGTPVGRHGGVVAAIEPGRLIVEEKELDFYGREQIKTEVLELPREGEPQPVGRE